MLLRVLCRLSSGLGVDQLTMSEHFSECVDFPEDGAGSVGDLPRRARDDGDKGISQPANET